MSILLLIDGYNLAHPIAPSHRPDPGWLERNRSVLLRDLTEHLPVAFCQKTCVVFDAANPPKDRPSRYQHHGIDVRFAVDYLSADDLLEELIRSHHTPKRLMVVSSDHRVQTAARRRGAKFYDGDPWLDDLTDGKIRLAVPFPVDDTGAGQGGSQKAKRGPSPMHGNQASPRKPRVEDPAEVSDWMRKFGFDTDQER